MSKELKIKIRKGIKMGDFEGVKKILETNKKLLLADTPFGSWLHVASDFNKLEIVKYLIEKGLDINKNGGIGNVSPIVEASGRGHLNIVKYLLKKGAKIDLSSAEKNPIFSAIYNGQFEVVKYLVEQGLDISVRYKDAPLENMNAYDYADQFGQLEIAKYLKTVMKQKNI